MDNLYINSVIAIMAMAFSGIIYGLREFWTMRFNWFPHDHNDVMNDVKQYQLFVKRGNKYSPCELVNVDRGMAQVRTQSGSIMSVKLADTVAFNKQWCM